MEDAKKEIEPLTITNVEDDWTHLSSSGNSLSVDGATARLSPDVAANVWWKMKEVAERDDVFSITMLGAALDIAPDDDEGGWEMFTTTVYDTNVVMSAQGRHSADEVEFMISLAEVEDYLISHDLIPEDHRRSSPPTPKPAPSL